jgi:hypothetical protein
VLVIAVMADSSLFGSHYALDISVGVISQMAKRWVIRLDIPEPFEAERGKMIITCFAA